MHARNGRVDGGSDSRRCRRCGSLRLQLLTIRPAPRVNREVTTSSRAPRWTCPEVPEVLPSVGMKSGSLFLAASVMAAGIAIVVAPSAHAANCNDGDRMDSPTSGMSYTCIAGNFREGGRMPPTWRGNPCTEGTTFTGLGADSHFTYKCVGGRYCILRTTPPGLKASGRKCP